MFPESFYSFLHNYVSTINEIAPSTSYASTPAPPTPSSTSVQQTRSNISGPTIATEPESRPSDSDHRLERLWEDYESIEPYLLPELNQENENIMDVNVEYTSANPDYKPLQVSFSLNHRRHFSKAHQDVIPVEVHIPNRDSKLKTLGGRRSAVEGIHRLANENTNANRSSFTDGPALIILALLTSNIRNCRLPSTKIHALDVFLALSCHLTDEAKLDRMVPYVVELLHDDSALVRSAAMRTLLQVVCDNSLDDPRVSLTIR